MIQDIYPKTYHNEYEHKKPDEDAAILIYQGQRCLMHVDRDGEVLFPEKRECQGKLYYTYLFRIDDEEYYLGRYLSEKEVEPLLKKGFKWEDIREFRTGEPRDRCFAGVTGFQLGDWYRRHIYCGSCGAVLEHDENERMLRCPECGEMYYPQICPAVIVGVINNGRILMSHYRGRSFKKFALIAGFNESGESIEQTVHREVMEEVGLPVTGLRYYKSQPWAFSDTLLMGFFCELEGYNDKITLDQEELLEAGWYLPSEIPEDTDRASLTGEMMSLFRECDGELPIEFPERFEQMEDNRHIRTGLFRKKRR
ncbi:MAG: NAD(+) diphosphatase [Eubacterium sp.]|nr:NAD(+) diphosphatase [Eubacterium sp.]